MVSSGQGETAEVRRTLRLMVLARRDYFDYAVMSGGDILLQGQAEVMGNMRANGRISFQGTSTHLESPNVHNGGRMLTATRLEVGSVVQVSDNQQEVRSAGDIASRLSAVSTSVSPFTRLDVCAAMFKVSALSRFSAISNEVRVRVLAS